MNNPKNPGLEQLKRAVLLKKLQQTNSARNVQTTVAPLPTADRTQPLPLSWAQQRLWFIDQFDPAASQAYHIQAGLRLHGKLDKAALKRVLDRIVARHEVLRSQFVSNNGQPWQQISATGSFALLEQDLSALAETAQAAAVQQLCAEETCQHFSLSAGPLIRGRLLGLSDNGYLLLITQHHIVSDGWSLGLLIKEVCALYSAFSQGLPDPLPELSHQYADYAVWQRAWLQGETLQAQIRYWQDQLNGAPELLALPLDYTRPAQQSYAGGRIGIRLPAGLSAGLKQLAQSQSVTLFMVLLAGWSVLMARLSNQTDVVIGTPVTNRPRSELEALIGFFVNTLALRVRLADDPSVSALLAQIKATSLAAYAHQDLPFEQVVEALNPTRNMAYHPIFQVMLSLDNTPDGGALALPGLALEPIGLAHTTTHFDLALALSATDEGLVGALEYASDVFAEPTVRRIARYFENLLAGMVADPQQTIGQLPLMKAAERDRILYGFNHTATACPQHLCAHQLFERHAARQPDAPALD
ncbi:condensation domain-containing protein, partial [Methylovulum psychrotolerans]|uniref:condensation domain-containing protein n=1 Tax=Methylovulum psychrotolerans TaxID=1704499 RepID=UPI0020135622